MGFVVREPGRGHGVRGAPQAAVHLRHRAGSADRGSACDAPRRRGHVPSEDCDQQGDAGYASDLGRRGG
eukprot:13213768-Alexandrium_andersonii.AAC.1